MRCFINNNKFGPLVIIRENINAKKYREILQEHFYLYISLDNENVMFFQDDNAPVHGAKIVTDWENENLIIFSMASPEPEFESD